MGKAEHIISIVIVLAATIAGGSIYAYYMLHDNDQTAVTGAISGSDKVSAQSASDECLSSELSLSSQPPGSGSDADADLIDVVLTNIGERDCKLSGFPRVLLTDNDGNQIGSTAQRSAAGEAVNLTLKSGGTAISILTVPSKTDAEKGKCQEGATKLKVYPPGSAEALTTKTGIEAWCPGFAVQALQRL